ncbi:adenylate kinase [Candidatus Woesearchaeota archaeon]|nr:MAG: adenylate kinase [Candidatus Woesearchaeota archaeon]
MRLIMLGPAGSGKGTQAEMLAKKYNIPHISTGDLFRALDSNSDLRKEIKKYMDKGELVPDDLVIKILKERLGKPDCEKGFILDGVPRNVTQAELIKKMGVEIDNVINIEVSDEEVTKRLSSRRVCKNGHIFSTIYPKPKKEGVCDVCGEPLFQRDDDKPEAIKERLKIYHEQTSKLLEYYQNLIIPVNGEQPIEEVFNDIVDGLKWM